MTGPILRRRLQNFRANRRGWVSLWIFALLFVMFDVEAVFIFPWAVGLERYQVYGLAAMGLFIFVLTLPLLYAWRKGVLRWV